MRFIAQLAGCALVALLIVPTSAPAAVRTLKGQVVGSTFAAGSATVVPVLLDARSARRAKLRTPLARLLVPRGWKVRAPGRTTLVSQHLRAGDAFRVRVTVPRRRNGAAYPVLRPRARTLVVTRRGTALSAAELQEHVAALYGYVNGLASYIVREFAALHGQVAGLRGDLAGLRGSLAALQARVDGLEAGFQAQLDQLIARVTALETQLASITAQLSQLSSDVSALQAQLAGIAPGDLAGALSDIAALQALVGGVDVSALSSSLNSLSSSTAASDATLQGNIDAANAALATVQGQVAFLCSAGLVKGPLLNLQLLGPCPA